MISANTLCPLRITTSSLAWHLRPASMFCKAGVAHKPQDLPPSIIIVYQTYW